MKIKINKKVRKEVKWVLLIILISIPFWMGINSFQENFEGLLYYKKIQNNPPKTFVANISETHPELKYKGTQVSAKSSFSLEIGDKRDKVLFSKNPDERLPIASITKLMTAVVASDVYDPGFGIKISKEAVAQEGDKGNLKAGEVITTKNLLHVILIESSNDAAYALAEAMGMDKFINLMNEKAKELHMTNSHFYNPTGLDKEDSEISDRTNYSSAEDLVKLARYIIKDPMLIDIIGKDHYVLRLRNGVVHHTLVNTNKLLGEIPGIVGGKTGYTGEAGECLLLITKSNKNGNYIVSVVLNSRDRFEDMKEILNYVNSTY